MDEVGSAARIIHRAALCLVARAYGRKLRRSYGPRSAVPAVNPAGAGPIRVGLPD